MLGVEAFYSWAECLGSPSAANCTRITQNTSLWLGLLALALLFLAGRRLITAVVTLRALALTPMFSRRLSHWVKSRDYSEKEFLSADGASGRWFDLRRQALERLSGFFRTQYAQSNAWGDTVREEFSDLRF